jgi:hypothetical protein
MIASDFGDDRLDPHDDGVLDWLNRQERDLREQLDALKARENTLHQYEIVRANLCWDDDRRLQVEELAVKLGRKPAAIRARLASSRHGTLWLFERWKHLGAVLDRDSGWDEAQTRLAFDLLGIDPALRCGDPWTAAGLETPRALVDRELKALELALVRRLNQLDELERLNAMAGSPVQPSSALTALKRETSACWRRLLAVQKLIEAGNRRAIERAFAIEAESSEPRAKPARSTPPPPTPPGPAPTPERAARTLPRPLPVRQVATAMMAPAPAAAATVASAPTGNRRARRAALRLERQAR